VLAGGVAFLAINPIVNRTTRSHIFKEAERLKPAQAAIVLGAKVYPNGAVSPIVYDRLLKGAELYKKGIVQKILVTGDHGQKEYDEVNTIRKHLEQLGVARRDIFMDHAGFSTYDSIYRARAVFEVSSAVIVTQNFHLARAVYMARKRGIDAEGYIADRRRYLYRRHYAIREYFARIKDFLLLNLFNPRPKYLGQPIPITGDGTETAG